MDRTLLEAAFADMLGSGTARLDEPMAAHTTFRIGGPVDMLVEPRSEGELRLAYARCRDLGADVFTLGLGSNVLVADRGLRGVVVKVAGGFSGIRIDGGDGALLHVEAGASNAQVAEAACAAGLSGYEFASGIPGTVGGAAVMNAGAYGGEFADVAASVRCLALDGTLVEVPAGKAGWGYRRSLMGEEDLVVVGAVLRLSPDRDGPRAIRERMDDLARRRADKQPLELPSAGSTFKRPEGFFAGKLVQDAGLRGFRVGGAQVSEKHTGFVVNAGGATAEDVRRLIVEVRRRVRESSGVTLEPEVRMWGFEGPLEDGGS
ncbi:UDP-N-acetylenolpyruvoylglucosamine reductase [Gordonibacter sp. An230]|uniref:UDP-N-acetylmuramate dehydrogenase n=1 Tax=Gordonibacter sp. An230 TaxID=1965592 RepID=UPI000B3A8DFB|nr:UDP-N-acetylmuramate dehydrogenase [Gordonibacter sp. An230]OUO86084.1 UDP-N-acetylenolpyruvoylglucosamine reductase [Gordonibacter sp. An230]